ncbi:hypothetical protein BDB01DRAFT_856174 [Pilobolus umbonatus]|nr:hypothetical protein BDB01DRAFT_856174 [Pilobolus umbonatus]
MYKIEEVDDKFYSFWVHTDRLKAIKTVVNHTDDSWYIPRTARAADNQKYFYGVFMLGILAFVDAQIDGQPYMESLFPHVPPRTNKRKFKPKIPTRKRSSRKVTQDTRFVDNPSDSSDSGTFQ